MKFSKAADGRWEGSLSVPRQGMESTMDKLLVTEDQISFALVKPQAGFKARWNAKDKAWTGT